jgi:hypothetical protein
MEKVNFFISALFPALLHPFSFFRFRLQTRADFDRAIPHKIRPNFYSRTSPHTRGFRRSATQVFLPDVARVRENSVEDTA